MAAKKEEILEAIASMTVLEVSELVKAMEEKFGVSAAAPVAVAAAAPTAATATGAAAETPNFSSIALTSSETSKTVMEAIVSKI